MSAKIIFQTTLFILAALIKVSAQEQRVFITGNVLMDSIPAVDINVINTNTDSGTITDQNGQFSIHVSLGDKVLFNSLIFLDRTITISQTHIQSKTMEVYLEPDMEWLDEIILENSAPHNFAVHKKAQLNIDRIDLEAPPDATKLTNPNSVLTGIDFGSILVLIFKKKIAKNKEKRKQKKITARKIKEFPDLVRNLYGDDFFIVDLEIPPHKIELFLDYCRSNGLGDYYNEENDIIIKGFIIKQHIKFKSLNSPSKQR